MWCGLEYGAQADSERDKKKRGGYLRFLKSFIPSISVMYWNPFSMSCVASLMLLAVLHVYSSSSFKLSSCTYFNVVSIFLCPICCLTYRMSLVFAYSLVAK